MKNNQKRRRQRNPARTMLLFSAAFLLLLATFAVIVQFWGFHALAERYGLLEQRVEIYRGALYWTQLPVLQPIVQTTNRFFREPSYELSTDHNGLRTTVCNPAMGTSVICLGDSEMWGIGVDDAQTFASQLSCLLNQRPGSAFVVHNLGISGYDTEREYLCLLRWMDSFRPDWIVLGFNENDNWIPLESIRNWEVPFFRLKAYFILRALTIHLPSEQDVRHRGYGRCLEFLESIRELCRQQGARLVVYHVTATPQILVGYPPPPDIYLDLSSELHNPENYRNLLPDGGFGHLNARGHAECAQAVAESILSADEDSVALDRGRR